MKFSKALLACGLTLLTFFGPVAGALALSEDQLVAKLNVVPVFTIVDSANQPLLLTPKSNKQLQLLYFYLDADLANQALSAVRKQNSDKSKNFRVAPTGLGNAFKAVKEQVQKKDNKVNFQFLSSPGTRKYATELARKKDAKLKDFPGVPVFYVSGGPSKGILTLKRDNQEFVPMFFSEKDLEQNLSSLRQKKSDVKNLTVEVATLDAVVGSILSGKNDAEAQKITFVPARDALEYIKTVQKPSASK